MRVTWVNVAKTVVVPVAGVFIATVIRAAVDPLILDDDAPFMLLLAVVMGSAYYAGLAAGLIATTVALGAATFFMFPQDKLLSPQSAAPFVAVSFVVEAVTISLLCHALHRARWRAERNAEQARLSAAEARQLAEEASTLQREVSEAADLEQARIGQDLHDDLGQFLTGIALSGELMARRLDREQPAVSADLRKIVHMVNEAVNRVRQLARGLSPMTVDPDSLPMLLSELQEQSAELSGKTITFEMTGMPVDMPHQTVLHLYRIAQEAVSNALRHSGGDTIEIELDYESENLRLTVTDNGTGKPARHSPDATASRARPGRAGHAPKGMGTRVMHFRARTVGAQLEITAREEQTGTRVSVLLPRPPEPEEAGTAEAVAEATVTPRT